MQRNCLAYFYNKFFHRFLSQCPNYPITVLSYHNYPITFILSQCPNYFPLSNLDFFPSITMFFISPIGLKSKMRYCTFDNYDFWQSTLHSAFTALSSDSKLGIWSSAHHYSLSNISGAMEKDNRKNATFEKRELWIRGPIKNFQKTVDYDVFTKISY